MNAVNNLRECSDCGRKILIIQSFYGVPHSEIVSVVCGECLAKKGVDQEWKRHNRDEALELELWLSEFELKDDVE